MKLCPQCKAREEDDRLIACPKCGASYDGPTSVPRDEIAALERRVLKKLTRKVAGWLFGGLSVITVIGIVQFAIQFGALWRTGVSKLELLLNNRIADEFKTERIRNTISEVAQTQAKALMKSNIQPEIDKVKADTAAKSAAFDAFLTKLREENQSAYGSLASEVTQLKDRNHLMQLADDAVSTGNRKALDELRSVKMEENNPLAPLASSLFFQVKNFYLNGNRIGGYRPTMHRFGLTEASTATPPPSDDAYTTEDLLNELRHGDDWRDRAKSADSLVTRRTKTVPDALFDSIKNDPHLEVARNAVLSFCTITGYQKKDVFGEDDLADWWRAHRTEVLAGLPD